MSQNRVTEVFEGLGINNPRWYEVAVGYISYAAGYTVGTVRRWFGLD